MNPVHPNHYEVSLHLPNARDGEEEILSCLMESLQISRANIVEEYSNAKWRMSVYFSVKSKADQFIKKLKALKLTGITCRIRLLKKEDWLTKWQKDFQPFALTKNIFIVPAWLKDKFSANGKQLIYIDTSVAFGTGLHATTRFMAGFIERCRGRFQSFLDIGTGTGILSLVALLNQARKVYPLEISPDAARIARENFIRNGFSSIETHAVDFNKFQGKISYDFVAANLITQDLISFKKKIISKVNRGGYLAVSGISLGNYLQFKKEYAALPLRCLKIEKGDGWVALLYKKTI